MAVMIELKVKEASFSLYDTNMSEFLIEERKKLNGSS